MDECDNVIQKTVANYIATFASYSISKVLILVRACVCVHVNGINTVCSPNVRSLPVLTSLQIFVTCKLTLTNFVWKQVISFVWKKLF